MNLQRANRLGGVALLVLAHLGCGKGPSVVCHPVVGSVTRDGKPLAEALVVYHPVSDAAGLPQKPIAYTDAEGRFKLTTYHAADGAPAGEYRVTVEQRAPKLVGEEMVRDGAHLLPAALRDPLKSGLVYTVVEGENEAPEMKIPK
jgi:hypothetical protein